MMTNMGKRPFNAGGDRGGRGRGGGGGYGGGGYGGYVLSIYYS